MGACDLRADETPLEVCVDCSCSLWCLVPLPDGPALYLSRGKKVRPELIAVC